MVHVLMVIIHDCVIQVRALKGTYERTCIKPDKTAHNHGVIIHCTYRNLHMKSVFAINLGIINVHFHDRLL